MKEILRIDLRNYQESWPIHRRTAAKAVFYVEDKLVMLQSTIGDVKFVGGGIEEGESILDCLKREIKEESGYEVIPQSIKEIGIVIERRKDKYKDSIYESTTYMYSCEVDPVKRHVLSLTDVEIKYGMTCVFVSPEEAIRRNQEVLKKSEYTDWLHRDLELLKLLFN